jgi:hypothetical protein
MALEMRPECERCGSDLPMHSREAHICSFECTFCTDCVDGPLAGVCPNCGGELRPRPTRLERMLGRNPATGRAAAQ